MIVGEDLLTGIIVGLILSLATILYSVTHLNVDVRSNANRIDVYLTGAATFIRMPTLIDRLQHLPNDAEVHVHVNRLGYVDHACLDAIAAREK